MCFFFKQKTSYDMRISDWSSDVCSSDLRLEVVETGRRRRWSEDEKLKTVLESLQAPRQVSATARRHGLSRSQLLQWRRSFRVEQKVAEIGRASCRERACQNV